MTTYTAIANSQIDADSYLDTVLAAQWRDNVLAIQEGDASASGVRIQNAALAGYGSWGQAALAANAVGQAELKDALQQDSAAVTAGNNANIAFTGGVYTLGWGLGNTNFTLNAHGTVGYVAGIGVTNSAGTTQTYYFQARYIQASPPYNLGYGNIPLFIFVIVDNATGKAETVYTAPDAPWHYNGPTITKADFYKEDEGYRLVRPVEQELIVQGKNIKAEIRGAQRDIILTRLATEKPEPMLITQDIKNADMGLIPHPFLGNDLTGKTVVAINPNCDCVEKLVILRDSGESINELLHDGYLTIDNTALERGFDSSVQCCDIKWKITK